MLDGFENFGLETLPQEKTQKEISGILLPLLVNQYVDTSHIDRKGRLSPTTGAGHCARQSTLSGIYGYTNDWNHTSELYAKYGIAAEDYLARGINDVVVGKNIRLPEIEGLELGAELDIATVINNRFVIVESKTCGAVPSRPKIYQLNQLRVYMAYFGCDGILAYLSREVMDRYGNLKFAEYYIPYDREEAISTMTKIFLSRYCIDEKQLPIMTIEKISDCGFCPFTNFCWRGSKEYALHKMSDQEYLDALVIARDKAIEFLNIKQTNKRRDYLRKLTLSQMKLKDFLLLFDF